MICPECGAQQRDGVKFCTKCGKPLATSPQVTSNDSTKKSGLGIAAAVTTFLALGLIVALGVVTDGFGLLGANERASAPVSQDLPASDWVDPATELEGESESQSDGESAGEEGRFVAPEVRASVNDYSWEELSQISLLISSSATQDEAMDVAVEYHLCNEDGTLDGTQVKEFVIGNAMTVTMQIAGFNHDERADGSGMAGITFVARSSLGVHYMNSSDSTSGGWRDSDLREWMNSDLLEALPKEISSVVVPVFKYTNCVGETSDSSSVEATVDTLWAPAYSELGGHMDISDDDHDDVYNAEGRQYQLFADLGVSWDAPNDVLALSGVEFWWERTPDPLDGRYFMCVGPEGTPWYARVPSSELDVVLCFCV